MLGLRIAWPDGGDAKNTPDYRVLSEDLQQTERTERLHYSPVGTERLLSTLAVEHPAWASRIERRPQIQS